MNCVLPTYTKFCFSETNNSIESAWLYPSDFGESYFEPSENETYPRLTPVYNGKVLDIQTEFVHASLSGISIKHYYGKCIVKGDEDALEREERSLYEDHRTEGYDYNWFDDDKDKESLITSDDMFPKANSTFSSDTTSGSFEYRESLYVEGQPLCTLPKINYRNSFWNIHRPELCKLTWGQNYVGTSTVIEHLHEHLVQHGPLCEGYHTEEERQLMLNRELDDYVRLKVLACPRKLPPDEQLFNFKAQSRISKLLVNPRCKTSPVPEIKVAINDNERYLQLSDDEDDVRGKNVRRSKEEFCLTIGKHIRRPPILQPDTVMPEDYYTPELSSAGEEEGGLGLFYYHWQLFGEEAYEEEPDNKYESLSASLSEPDSLIEPCPPLIMDEFCRAAGKVDFSDLRCDPDF